MELKSASKSSKPFRAQFQQITWRQPAIAVATTLFTVILVIIGDVTPSNIPGIRGIFPASSVQMLASIWFGFWGLPACMLGGLVFHFIHGQSFVVALAISFGDLLTGLIPALLFRYLHLNYNLSTVRDWMLFLIGGILITPLPSALIGMTVLTLSNIVQWTSFWAGFGYWVSGAYFTNILVVSLALPLLSPLLTKKHLIILGVIS